MTQPEPAASQRELEQLAVRVDRIDEKGTRGSGVISGQLAQVIKDVGRLEGALTSHNGQHERERQDRTQGRRWLWGAVLTALAVLLTMFGLLIQIAGRTH